MFNASFNKICNKIGFKIDQNGILNRYLREEYNWQEHLKNTQQFILKCAKTKQKNAVLILGSGWWLDIPVDELTKIFKKVYLADIVHSKQIIYKASKSKQIELITTDITGNGAKLFYELANDYKKTKQKPDISQFDIQSANFGITPPIEADFIASVNILNQLDILLIDYISKIIPFDKNELLSIREKIQLAHINNLPTNKSCLISDFAEQKLNTKTAEVITEKNLIYASVPNEKKAEWLWNFDTHQTYHPNYNTRFRVGAWTI